MTTDIYPLRKPDVLCIGAQKAGTSWLHEVLGRHIDIWVPPFKELHFFDHKFVLENRKWTKWHVQKGVNEAIKGHNRGNSNPDQEYLNYLNKIMEPPMFNGRWYKFVFSRAPKHCLGLDVCPEYCTISDEGVKFVKKYLPKGKYIYIIRSPFERALSQLKMNVGRNANFDLLSEEKWFEKAKEPVVLQRGDYSQYVPRWADNMGSGNTLFLPFGEISRNPLRLLRGVEDFLSIRNVPHDWATRKIHPTQNFSVPPQVMDFLKEKTYNQEVFVREFFGSDFVSKMRET